MMIYGITHDQPRHEIMTFTSRDDVIYMIDLIYWIDWKYAQLNY